MWSYNYSSNSDELYHFGVKGMRWGHRKAVSTSGTSNGRRSSRGIKDYFRQKGERNLDRSGGSKGKAITKAVGAGVGRSAALAVGTTAASTILKATGHRTLSSVTDLAGYGAQYVNAAYTVGNVVGTATRKSR